MQAQSKKKAQQEKSEHEGGPLQIRGSDSPWNRDLCGSEVYTHSNAKPTRFTRLFSYAWNSLTPKIRTASQPALTRNGRSLGFFLVFIKKFLWEFA
jgi:hypothetical protein